MAINTAFREALTNFLSDAKRVAILGVGNELRCDDAAGIIVSEAIATKLPPNVFLFIGGSLPENFTGPIRKREPTHVLLVDATEFGGKPGDYGLFQSEQVQRFSFTTHSLPLTVFIEYLQESSSATAEKVQFRIVGIQPANTEIGEEVTPIVGHVAQEVAAELLAVLNDVMNVNIK